MTTFLYALAALAVGYVLGRLARYRASEFQNRSEARLALLMREHFNTPDYHLLNHVTLPLKDGTTQIDHILISRFGVFVIETKSYTGWIFANPQQAEWTQVLFRRKFKFRNPIFQNMGHVRAVQDLLDFLPPGEIRSAVVFAGGAEFKAEIPPGVYSVQEFIEYIRATTTEIMSINRMHFCVGRLEALRLAISGKTDLEHVQYLERRYGSAA